ncbi:hypothetical protein SCATT_57890 [Streptantibioticus cattleyicolor NRRL 8057 = DSM 46488]|uniref:Uncharacterized protein n=1 Tax=Streptantibioticus cattleyicolor (strain ATCC 35852 / DSM 46488 / JCM 4925 / NBRC 14057 / NRRL 8057) TaxID=1003195 RepID=G8X1D2_STREN|nr:hypothetical protein SCATT_57890 [Streptantibioticus cattleyicolor NRRL 8057 = DSM 46488]
MAPGARGGRLRGGPAPGGLGNGQAAPAPRGRGAPGRNRSPRVPGRGSSRGAPAPRGSGGSQAAPAPPGLARVPRVRRPRVAGAGRATGTCARAGAAAPAKGGPPLSRSARRAGQHAYGVRGPGPRPAAWKGAAHPQDTPNRPARPCPVRSAPKTSRPGGHPAHRNTPGSTSAFTPSGRPQQAGPGQAAVRQPRERAPEDAAPPAGSAHHAWQACPGPGPAVPAGTAARHCPHPPACPQPDTLPSPEPSAPDGTVRAKRAPPPHRSARRTDQRSLDARTPAAPNRPHPASTAPDVTPPRRSLSRPPRPQTHTPAGDRPPATRHARRTTQRPASRSRRDRRPRERPATPERRGTASVFNSPHLAGVPRPGTGRTSRHRCPTLSAPPRRPTHRTGQHARSPTRSRSRNRPHRMAPYVRNARRRLTVQPAARTNVPSTHAPQPPRTGRHRQAPRPAEAAPPQETTPRPPCRHHANGTAPGHTPAGAGTPPQARLRQVPQPPRSHHLCVHRLRSRRATPPAPWRDPAPPTRTRQSPGRDAAHGESGTPVRDNTSRTRDGPAPAPPTPASRRVPVQPRAGHTSSAAQGQPGPRGPPSAGQHPLRHLLHSSRADRAGGPSFQRHAIDGRFTSPHRPGPADSGHHTNRPRSATTRHGPGRGVRMRAVTGDRATRAAARPATPEVRGRQRDRHHHRHFPGRRGSPRPAAAARRPSKPGGASAHRPAVRLPARPAGHRHRTATTPAQPGTGSGRDNGAAGATERPASRRSRNHAAAGAPAQPRTQTIRAHGAAGTAQGPGSRSRRGTGAAGDAEDPGRDTGPYRTGSGPTAQPVPHRGRGHKAAGAPAQPGTQRIRAATRARTGQDPGPRRGRCRTRAGVTRRPGSGGPARRPARAGSVPYWERPPPATSRSPRWAPSRPGPPGAPRPPPADAGRCSAGSPARRGSRAGPGPPGRPAVPAPRCRRCPSPAGSRRRRPGRCRRSRPRARPRTGSR